MTSNSGTLWGAAPGDGGNVVVFGVPFVHGVARGGGMFHAPDTLRLLTAGERIAEGIWDYSCRRRVIERLCVSDHGNIVHRASMRRSLWFAKVEGITHALAKRGAIPLGIGGDHTVALPLASGVAGAHGSVQVVHLDAHHDYTPIFPETCPTHSNFIGFLAARPDVERIVQVGLRGYSSLLPVPMEKVVQTSVEEMKSVLQAGVPVYLSIDTDVFDPSIAPAVWHPLPMGLSLADLDRILRTITGLGCPIVGVDWSEYDPELDGKNYPTGNVIVIALISILAAIEGQLYGG